MQSRLRNFQTVEIDTQLVTDTAIYATGDVLVATVAIPVIQAIPAGAVRANIVQVALIDKDAQSGLMDIVFFDQNVSLGTINAPISISDANAQALVQSVPVTTYTTLTAGGVSSANIVLATPIFFQTMPGSPNLFVGIISRDAKTYTASGLFLRLSIQFISEEV